MLVIHGYAYKVISYWFCNRLMFLLPNFTSVFLYEIDLFAWKTNSALFQHDVKKNVHQQCEHMYDKSFLQRKKFLLYQKSYINISDPDMPFHARHMTNNALCPHKAVGLRMHVYRQCFSFSFSMGRLKTRKNIISSSGLG